MAQNSPFLSVVIPTFNRPDPLRRCLAAIAAHSWPRDRFEVIVVDDGSPEPLDEVVRAFRSQLDIALVRQENAGPGAARNHGARIARGDLLVFTDDDCLPEPAWLEAFAETHRTAPTKLLGGLTRIPNAGNSYAATSQLIIDSAYRFYNENPAQARFFASNNMAVPAKLFLSIGGFAEEFRIASEDRELCNRWHWKGHGLEYVPGAVAQHERKLDLGSFMRQHFNYGRGALQYQRERRKRDANSRNGGMTAHGRFIREVARGISGQTKGQAFKITCLLGLWQVVNATGYFYEFLSNKGER